MKVGLLGGSFNPPHKGHIHLSQLAIKKLGLNQVWWIPTAQNPFKAKSLYEDYEKRVAKCFSITKNLPKIRTKTWDEIYTEKLVKSLKNRYKTYEFFWLMGADGMERLHQWENFKNLLKLLPFVIVSRETFLKKLHKTRAFIMAQKLRKSNNTLPKLRIIRSKNLDISSTKIRSNELHH